MNKVSLEDVAHHIHNSIEGWSDYKDESYWTISRVTNDGFVFEVSFEDGTSQRFQFSGKEL